jgi:DNA-damage-inducible protein J
MESAVIRSRIDPVLKAEASRLFKSLGLSMSDAIRLFLHQCVAQKGLPFEVKTPNAETIQAMESVVNGEGLKSFSSVDAMWDDLHAPGEDDE